MNAATGTALARLRKLAGALGLILAAACGVALLAAAARPQAPARATVSGGQNWNAVVTRTPLDSHLLGNPKAPVKLVEYISYTCPHCAHFEVQSEAQLRLGFIAPGKGSIEVRNFPRDPIDMTVALLTHCGPPSKFFGNHTMFLRRQDAWLSRARGFGAAQQQRWSNPDFPTATRAIASDFGFYDMMATRGYDRSTLDRCLADKGLAERLAKHRQEAIDQDGVNGTPSFVLNGVPLAGTATWDTLKPQIEARLR